MIRSLKMLVLLLIMALNINVYAECKKDVLKNIKIDGVPVGKNAIANSNGTEYNITIKDTVSTVKIDAETDYVFMDGYGPRTVSTNETVKIKVNGAPECGVTTYYFNFIKDSKTTTTQKKEEKSDAGTTTTSTTTTTTTTTTKKVEPIKEELPSTDLKVKLKSLSVEGYTIPFTPENTKYLLQVDNTVTSLDIKVEKDNEEDSVVISENSKNLVEGTNIINISVVNKDGESIIYELTVERDLDLSNNNFLSELIIEGYTIPFDPSVETYNLTIKDEQSLVINPVLQDDTATASIENNSSLIDGSVIKINIVAANGEGRTYSIYIHKNKTGIMAIISDYWQYILIGVVGLIVLIVLIVLLIKGKKKKNTDIAPETIENNIPNSSVITNTIDASPNQMLENQAIKASPTIEPVQPAVTNNNQIPVEGLEIVKPQSGASEEKDLSKTEVFKL